MKKDDLKDDFEKEFKKVILALEEKYKTQKQFSWPHFFVGMTIAFIANSFIRWLLFE